MAASSKQYQLLFQLTAALGPGFPKTFKTATNTMKTLQENTKGVNQKLKDISAYRQQQYAVEKSRTRVKELEEAHNRLKAEAEEAGGSTEKFSKKIAASEKELEKAKKQASDQAGRLGELGDALRSAGINTDNLARDTEKLQKQYERLERTQQKVQKINEKKSAINGSKSQSKAQLAGIAGAAAAAGAAIYNGPVKKAADFQQQMSAVQAITGGVGKKELPAITKTARSMGLAFKTGSDSTETAMNILAAKAREMGAKTKFTAREAGEAMEYMAVAGWGADEMLNGISGVMDLAAASGADLGTTSDIITDSIENFGLSAKDTQHFVDVLAQTARKSNTDVLKLGESYKYVSPVAKAMGYSVEDINVALGLMANSGIKASSGGTALRTLLTNMANPTSSMAQAMEELGVSLDDGRGNMKTFHEIMKDLRKGFGRLKIPAEEFRKKLAAQNLALEKGSISQKVYDKNVMRLTKRAYGAEGALKAQAAASLAGKEGMSGLLAIVNASGKTFNSLTKDINDADGAAGEMAKTRLDNFYGSVTLAQSAFDALQSEIGDMFLPSLQKAVEKGTELINLATKFVQENPETVKLIGKIAAGFVGLKAGGLIAKIGLLSAQDGLLSIAGGITGIKGLGFTEFLGSFSGEGKGLGAVFGNVAGKLGGVKKAGPGFINYFKNIGAAGKDVSSAFKGLFGKGDLFKGIGASLKKVSSSFGSLLNKSAIYTQVKSLAGHFGGALSGLAGQLGGTLSKTGGRLLEAFLKPFSKIGGRIGMLLADTGTFILKSPLGRAGKIIGSGFGKITSFLSPLGNAISAMLGPLGKLGGTILGPLGGIVGKILPIAGVITVIITAFELLKENIDKVREFIKNTFGEKGLEVFDKAVGIITNVGNVVKNVFSDGNIGKARGKIEEIFGAKGVKVFDTLIDTIVKVRGAVSDIISFIVANVVPVAKEVFQVIAFDIVPGIISFIQEAAPVVMAVINEVIGLVSAAMPVIGELIKALMPVISDVITLLQTVVIPVVSQVMQFVADVALPVILKVVEAAVPVIRGVIDSIGNIIKNIIKVLKGVIEFVTGVFTGDWSKAWTGIKNIIKGIFGGLGEIIKAPVRVIINTINSVLDTLNGLEVPDWVPLIGGMKINIPKIPGFAKGTNRTPETFVAGEKGPELITNAPGRKVYTALQTKQIFSNMPGVTGSNATDGISSITSSMAAGNAKQVVLNVTYSPDITVNGGADLGAVKEMLNQLNEEFTSKLYGMVQQVLKEQEEQEGRMAYV